jgi:hypothetical protein
MVRGAAVVQCSTGAGPVVAVALFIPSPAVQNPVTQVTFTGEATLG